MSYKKSIFNMEIGRTQEDKILFFNSLTTAFGIMNKETQEVYNNIEKYDDEEISKVDSISPLFKNGFINDSSVDEPSMMKYFFNKAKVNDANLTLTIAPTLNCNMNCPYCFEKKVSSRMSQETMNRIVEFVKKKIKNGIKSLKVTWYGGEPLLEKETIYNLSKVLIDLCNEKDIDYTAFMITNGILLDQETAKRLSEECKVNEVQITLDGTEEVHNKRRVLLNNKNSFQTIIENIDKIIEFMRVYVRVNIDKSNLDDIENLINYIYDYKNWKQNVFMSFNPVVKVEDLCVYDKNMCFSNLDFGLIEANFMKKLYSKVNMDTKNLYPRPRFLACSALSANSFVIDPWGNLYKCWSDVGVSERKIGNLSEGIKINTNFTKWVLAELPEKCRECNTLPLCQGGCLYDYVYYGKEPQCAHSLETYKQNLKSVYESYCKKGNTIDANIEEAK